jgi:DNA-binding NarL/FixJ family response regulator
MIKVGLIDDHQSVLEGLKNYFEREFDVVFSITNPEKAVEYIKEYKPEVLVVDIVFPNVEYIEFYNELRNTFPEIRLISYSSLSNPLLEKTLYQIGVTAFINKADSLQALSDAINLAMRNPIVKKEELFSKSIQLTTTERKVLIDLSKGKTTKEIAKEVNRSFKTIENHRRNLLVKFKVNNVSELITTCFKIGLLK